MLLHLDEIINLLNISLHLIGPSVDALSYLSRIYTIMNVYDRLGIPTSTVNCSKRLVLSACICMHYQTKLKSVSLCCKSHCCKTAQIKNFVRRYRLTRKIRYRAVKRYAPADGGRSTEVGIYRWCCHLVNALEAALATASVGVNWQFQHSSQSEASIYLISILGHTSNCQHPPTTAVATPNFGLANSQHSLSISHVSIFSNPQTMDCIPDHSPRAWPISHP